MLTFALAHPILMTIIISVISMAVLGVASSFVNAFAKRGTDTHHYYYPNNGEEEHKK